MREIRQYKRLTLEEEILLARRVAQGDEVARAQFICANLGLGVHIARQFEGRGLEMMDLIAEGNTGLMKAVVKFDP